jgi:hypothetical protein
LAGEAAVDARDAGRSGVRAAVDKRQDTRVVSEGRDHEPRHGERAACLGRLQTALEARTVTRKGSTTDGAARAPEPIRTGWGAVPQPRCTLPGIKALTHGGVHAVATARERWATSTPTLQRGRPASTDQAARRFARQSPDIHQKIRAVCQDRFVCVQRHLTPSERTRFLHMTRGVPQWRTRRERMEPRDALCDRRCRTQRALGTLKKLRQWVNRCTWSGETVQTVFAPHRAHALTCLDDTVLPATAHAVERGHRRHRQRPKRVDRIRSQGC